ncbi:hypothetical protein FB45DRAFT_34692 [Roridomyces roridus]|uniref:Uncharacterized protein n=1 Tax=Roridomyces roridus TaxID=1738132 RepID=A0AAD7CKW5_9AGAR|nr:hypothetical protein FB45DRAFT_34692 [Roridomyces roridus]
MNPPHSQSDFSLARETEPPQYPGAFFPASQHLTVHGGTFASNVYIHEAPMNSTIDDYRRLTRSDIDLRREILLDDQCAHFHRPDCKNALRRMYSAKIHGVESERAVSVYHGANSEAEWREYVARHSRIWHPTVLQIFGLASFSGVHAVVAHDDMLLIDDFIDLHHLSHSMTVYMHVCWTDYDDYLQYRQEMGLGFRREETSWVRLSTGRLCVELASSNCKMFQHDLWYWGPTSPQKFAEWKSPSTLNDANAENGAMQTLPVVLYHDASFWIHGRLSHLDDREISEVPLGAVITSQSNLQTNAIFETVACVSSEPCDVSGYHWLYCSCEPIDTMLGERASTGWTRFNAAAIYNSLISVGLHADDFWLPQANHVFHRLNITSGQEDYAFVVEATFTLYIPAPTSPCPSGYLFVCPLEHLRTGRALFAWPQCPWFWSLDPSGISRLTPETARSLGFPRVEQKTRLWSRRWDTSVYEGLRKFHAAKGFDPYSQDLAKHLGCHLMKLSGDKESGHAHVEGVPEAEAQYEMDPGTGGASHLAIG